MKISFFITIFLICVISCHVSGKKLEKREITKQDFEDLKRQAEEIFKQYQKNGSVFVPNNTVSQSARIFFGLLSNPCNSLSVTFGLGDIKCSISCRLAGQTSGGYCDNGECLCNEDEE